MIDLKIILNVFIALFLYNIILKAFAATLVKYFLQGPTYEKQKKSFREKLKEKLEEQDKQ